MKKRGEKGEEKPKYRIHHNKKLFWIIIILLAVLIFLIIYIRVSEKEKIIGGDQDEHGCYLAAGYSWCEEKQKCLRSWEEACDGECTIDSDCIAAECCHPASCVHKSKMPECDGIACTEECRGDTLDCGQGECKCQEGKCVAVIG